MIVEIKESQDKAVVLAINSNGGYYVHVLPNEKARFGNPDYLLFSEFTVIDSGIPSNWQIDIYRYENEDEIPDWLYSQYNDDIFYLHPKAVSPEMIVNFFEVGTHNYDEEISMDEYVVFKEINQCLRFHEMEEIKVSYVEEYENLLVSKEQRHQNKLDAELDEYLRVGEELAKENEQSS